MSRGRVSRPKRPRNYPEECWRKVPFAYNLEPAYLRWTRGKGAGKDSVAEPASPAPVLDSHPDWNESNVPDTVCQSQKL